MPNLLIDTIKDRTYDAIVIGSGASGGWAAKELCDKGLKTLILERGRDVKHIKDYPTAGKSPWQFEYRGSVPLEQRKDFQLARNAREETFHWAIRDDEQPFIQEKPFRWFRGYHVGGKSLLWGRNPSNSYLPRFRNLQKQEMNFRRGYAIGIGGGRGASSDTGMIGDQLRENLLHPSLGNWNISSWMMGETVPMEKNHVRLHRDLKDKYGIPQLIVSCEWSENDDKMVEDYVQQSREMFERAGFTNINAVDTRTPPGADIHEMGGVRMGLDPKTSLLNGWNQLHHCKNVFVTDGACMTSTGTQNPTLTYMALTARAANHAVEEIKKKNL